MPAVPANIGRYCRTRFDKIKINGCIHFLQARTVNPQANTVRIQRLASRLPRACALFRGALCSLTPQPEPAAKRWGSGNKNSCRADLHLQMGGPLSAYSRTKPMRGISLRACAAAKSAPLDSPERAGPTGRSGSSSSPPLPPRISVRGLQSGFGVLMVLLVLHLYEAPERRGIFS